MRASETQPAFWSCSVCVCVCVCDGLTDGWMNRELLQVVLILIVGPPATLQSCCHIRTNVSPLLCLRRLLLLLMLLGAFPPS